MKRNGPGGTSQAGNRKQRESKALLKQPWPGRWGHRDPLQEARQEDSGLPAKPLLCLQGYTAKSERRVAKGYTIIQASTPSGEREGGR